MRRLLLLSVFLLLPLLSAQADFVCGPALDAGKSKQLMQRVETSYRSIQGLSADFTQESMFLGFGERVKSSGKVLFNKPGMMDWTYEAPERQRFIADGRTLWFFQPQMNQVTVGQFQQSFQSGLPVSFLLGLGSLSQDFVTKQACESGLGVVFTLEPKNPDPSLQSFRLLVDTTRALPIGARVVDVGGNETQIEFTNLSTDVALSAEQFTFEIPKGVDVIDQRDGAGLEQ
jgi:outer membrane lipoprotein carrier protein